MPLCSCLKEITLLGPLLFEPIVFVDLVFLRLMNVLSEVVVLEFHVRLSRKIKLKWCQPQMEFIVDVFDEPFLCSRPIPMLLGLSGRRRLLRLSL